jgi:hypothetical protein
VNTAKSPDVVHKVIAKAWSDPAFKSELLKDANAALGTLGIAIPKGMTVRVFEDTATERHYVLPPQPLGELTDELLEVTVGGFRPAVHIPSKGAI